MKEERLTIRLTSQEKEMLKEYAESKDLSVGYIVRQAIKQYFENNK